MPDKSTTGFRINWPMAAIIFGGLIIIITLVWQIVSRRSSPSKRKPIHKGAARQSQKKFCRNCGEPIDEGDNFCSGCGKDL